ncbi:MAG TPA: nickel pincer cofactor biosynthesis protein LarB [Jatrophihabitans sp.]|jgi:NCAIR mutase (PurE)-related protein|nr:nickel pincer cofactor biosynthesis protein LarB [Jatrophihabitans sp.]
MASPEPIGTAAGRDGPPLAGVRSDRELWLDHGRRARTGIAEAVYAPGKSPSQCADAVAGLLAGRDAGPVVLTRANPAQADTVLARNPGGVRTAIGEDATGAPLSTVTWAAVLGTDRTALVLTAGTADLPVAREAQAVLEAYGHRTQLVADAGVAGLHRALAQRERLAAADVVIVVAGMEGALASVVAGLTAAPVIAVPTSTGYGAGLEGVTALLGMLASCSPGVTVVGIDNGFGAACAAVRIMSGGTGR